MSKKKIIHFIDNLGLGGAETLILQYALNIDKEKYDFIIITSNSKTNSLIEIKLKKAGIKVYYLEDLVKQYNNRNIFKKLYNRVLKYKKFNEIIQVESPSIIHSHLYVNEYILPLRTRKLNIKTFYTVHSNVDRLFGVGKFKNRIVTKLCFKLKGMTPIALHNEMKNDVNKLFNIDECVVLNNAINMSEFKKDVKIRAKIREKLGINDNMFVLGHVGRFHEVKNHKFLINVFENLIQKKPQSCLILIGEGDTKKNTQELVKKKNLTSNVYFLGNRKDIGTLMNAMDVFVLPSKKEGFGNVLIEAQTVGLHSVISSTVPKEVDITNNITRLSLDDSLEKWTEAILNSTSMKLTEKDLDKLNNYDIRNVIVQLQNLYG